MPFTMGSLYWQFNDVWPVFSWSSIDYYGQWKALHYVAKRLYSNLMISVRLEDSEPARKLKNANFVQIEGAQVYKQSPTYQNGTELL